MNMPGITRVQDDLQVRVLINRIIDPERTRPVVVITTGDRIPRDQLSPERIATGIGQGVEVAMVTTGRLTYTLRDGLPDDTDVFGDAARTYPVGIAWHDRPERAPLRYAQGGHRPVPARATGHRGRPQRTSGVDGPDSRPGHPAGAQQDGPLECASRGHPGKPARCPRRADLRHAHTSDARSAS